MPHIKNMVKKDLTFIEMALAIHKIKKTHDDLSQKEIAKMLGKTKSFISTACRIGVLDQKIIDMLYKYRKYKFANNLKVCNRLVRLEEVRGKIIAFKMAMQIKDKEERDGFDESVFLRILTKEIQFAKELEKSRQIEGPIERVLKIDRMVREYIEDKNGDHRSKFK